jgi:hypothetical protein
LNFNMNFKLNFNDFTPSILLLVDDIAALEGRLLQAQQKLQSGGLAGFAGGRNDGSSKAPSSTSATSYDGKVPAIPPPQRKKNIKNKQETAASHLASDHDNEHTAVKITGKKRISADLTDFPEGADGSVYAEVDCNDIILAAAIKIARNNTTTSASSTASTSATTLARVSNASSSSAGRCSNRDGGHDDRVLDENRAYESDDDDYDDEFADDDEVDLSELGQEQLAGLVRKEAEIQQMAHLTASYQQTIEQLKSEIRVLHQDHQQLQRGLKKASASGAAKGNGGVVGSSGNNNTAAATATATAGHSGNGSDVAATRLKLELKEKTRLLEEKLKILRQKEVDYRKLNLEKDRAAKEAMVLKASVEEAKRAKVALQRKMKEDAVNHQVEKKKLEHLQQQSKQRELQTQRNLAQLEEQLSKKENVWKSQLAAKERESQQLKELVGKQERARAQKTALATAKSNINITASSTTSSDATATSTSVGAVPLLRANQLKGWCTTEVAKQRERNNLELLLQRDIQLRTTAARSLHALRQRQSQLTPPPTQDSDVDVSGNINYDLKALRRLVLCVFLILSIYPL